ncbi:sulfotransferase domain-containing protein [Nodosilinea nodulosa]|uniref:sulfotransferase domain-containing protein n=1 Tax=Nodosilinea nodulosa TaxID=416001 RepID=UPI0002F8B9EA|nr:sulfotransferase domain-containing protein [Nodosilinea nodulosa]
MTQAIDKPAQPPLANQSGAGTHFWPSKTRELHSHHFDSTIWNDFQFRDDDVIIATYAKSGTTWMQQIVAQLIFNGQEGLNVSEMSPWMDLRVPPAPEKMAAVEAQTHRRFLKTHLPVDALVFSPQAKYIYIGRDGRDVLWSLYNHHASANGMFYDILNNTPGLVGPPIEPPPSSIRQYFHDWLQGDGYPFWSMWENVRSWWEIRHLPNVLMVHYAQLKQDMPGQMRRIAAFLDIPIDQARWDAIVEHCTFDYMKNHAEQVVPLAGQIFEGGAKTFINKGTNGRWRDTLTTEDIHWYETVAETQLGADCAHWLANGETPAK